MKWLLFAALAAAAVWYTFWIYLRVELAVPHTRWLAAIRASVVVTLLLLLFDPRLPPGLDEGAPRWVLLDASLSMSSGGSAGAPAWEDAVARARELRDDGWAVLTFGSAISGVLDSIPNQPRELATELAPALRTAAEAGVRDVRVLSDMRLHDAIAVEAELRDLPLSVDFESLSTPGSNVGLGRFHVPDVPAPGVLPVAEIEVFGGTPGDSTLVTIHAEGVEVAAVRLPLPSEGRRSVETIELPAVQRAGEVRYTAVVGTDADPFLDDQRAASYANIGFEAGAVVLVSFRADWEPRYLLPVLEETTGLPASGFLRAGEDRWVRVGRAADRGAPADSASVRRAASRATLLVVHGLGPDAGSWIDPVLASSPRRLVFPDGRGGAERAGIEIQDVRDGEWYASADVPVSPVAGAFVGLSLQGLPPLSNLLIPESGSGSVPLVGQLRGAGAGEGVIELHRTRQGRVAVALASDWWRWAMREEGREPYRRLWSAVAGWLLQEDGVSSSVVRPMAQVVDRGAAPRWVLPADSTEVRLEMESEAGEVVESLLRGSGEVTTEVLEPGMYEWRAMTTDGDTVQRGRFDVAGTTDEMSPPVFVPTVVGLPSTEAGNEGFGRPLRTHPLPYLLMIFLLCTEWVIRRRTGLR